VTASTGTPIRTVVIADSTHERAQLTAVLQTDGDIAVMGQAHTGEEGIRLVAREHPDVVLLNLHLEDGSSAHTIEQIMAYTPTPILVLSSRNDGPASRAVVEALVAGALDAARLPARWTAEAGTELRRSVRQLRKVHVIRHPRGALGGPSVRRVAPQVRLPPVVAVAASTGGPSALATLLAGLGALDAPVLVVQHLHPDFTDGLVEWMARVSALPVESARNRCPALPGRVYLAPGGVHLRLASDRILILDPNPATTHRPSADQLFQSVAQQAGPAGIGVILTGMGDDGAKGLLAMHLSGGRTLGQDEATCAVFGMPQAAYRLGAVRQLLPLDQLSAAIRRAVREVGA
jgi:two-component system chemotaxis response regulator CheB